MTELSKQRLTGEEAPRMGLSAPSLRLADLGLIEESITVPTNGHDTAADDRTSNPPAFSLANTIGVFRTWLHLPDPGVLELSLGAYIANLLPGNPVWLVIVDSPGAGKTEIVRSLDIMPLVRVVGDITIAGLLSGTSRKDMRNSPTGGILHELGHFGILVLKDLGSILSMRQEQSGPLLGALREVHDGHWTRTLGTDGGHSYSWKGKIGIIAAATPVIDEYHEAMAALGERFILYRPPTGDDGNQLTLSAMEHNSHNETMLDQLRLAVQLLLCSVKVPESPDQVDLLCPLNMPTKEWIADVAGFTARCRSAVRRDRNTHEITLMVGREKPTRLAISLLQLYRGLLLVGVPLPRALYLLSQVALSSMPQLRRTLIEILAIQQDWLKTSSLAGLVHCPSSTTRRALQDLECHQVVELYHDDSVEKWRLDDWGRTEYARLFGGGHAR